MVLKKTFILGERLMMKQNILLILLVLACGCDNKKKDQDQDENVKAKELFQGVWLDDDSEMPLFFVKGDTIYYSDIQNAPVAFEIIKDSLYMYGNEMSRYQIDKQGEHIFWFHSLAGDIIKLHKTENPDDSLAFLGQVVQVIPAYTEVTQKDSVVTYDGKRYRAYVYINPSKKKVINTSYSEDGISVDNVYYDNVMHICVYEGKKSLYSSDITKQTFMGMVPDEFLQRSILSDMVFTGITRSGFHYLATICVPKSAVCYMVELNISFDGKLTLSPMK